MGDLTRNFDRSEFACKCGCGLAAIDPMLVDLLQMSRDATGLPYHINAGCRCFVHNAMVGGKPESAHLPKLVNSGVCKAADIACSDSHTRFIMLSDLIKRFKRLEVGTTWLHVDLDQSLPQEVIFLS